MRAVVFANGELLADPEDVRREVEAADLVIAADGGTAHLWHLGLRPHVVVGDLDSIGGEVRGALEAGGVELIVHPATKDESDLELALLLAQERGAEEVVVLGGWGGRVDHALANVLLLAHPRLAGLRIWFVIGRQRVTLVRRRLVLRGQVGDLLSLLPVGGDVMGIVTRGLQYPLRGETLYLGPARGVSYVFEDEEAEVRVGEGLLLAIYTPAG